MQNFRKYDIHMEICRKNIFHFLQRGIMKTEKPGIKGKDCFIKREERRPEKAIGALAGSMCLLFTQRRRQEWSRSQDHDGRYTARNSTVEFKEFEVPKPGHGEVLIQTKASTICGSDIRCIYREHVGKGPRLYSRYGGWP